MNIYLAGPIRDGREDDFVWRNIVADALIACVRGDAFVMNPCEGKSFDQKTGVWTQYGRVSHGRMLVAHDVWMIRRADVVIANLQALAEGYPCIGTIAEIGMAAALNKLVYAILPPAGTLHTNGMFVDHPFIEELSAEVFRSVAACVEYLQSQLSTLKGRRL